MKSIITTLLITCFMTLGLNSAWAVTVSVRVAGSSNDAEERFPPNTTMTLSSSDLELGYDGSTRQFIGLRFQALNIPQGATINSAYIEFEVDETDAGTTNVVIFGEDTDDASTFASGASNISNRTRTAASVNWSIPAWSSVSAKQQTPDITVIVQQIINRGGWVSGNDLVVIIEPGAGCNSGSCSRTAESVNGESANAPLLVVDYTLGPATAYAWFQLDEFSGALNGTAGELVDQEANVTTAFALGTGSGVDTVSAQVCNGVNVPSNTTDAARYGVDTAIDIDDDIGNRGTISFWYSSNNNWSGGGDRALFDASPDDLTADDKFFVLMLRNDGALQFAVEDNAASDFIFNTSTQGFIAGQWAHVAVSWDMSGSRRIYVNGNLQATSSNGTSGQIGELRTLYLGDNRSNYHFGGTANSANGVIDEFRIYASVQTQAEIQTDMNATHPCASTPIVEYQMDSFAWNGVSGEVIDAQGALNATAINGISTDGLTPAIAGDPGTCRYGAFDGVDDYIDLTGMANLTGSFTMSTWIYANETGNDQRIFVDDETGSGGFGISLGDGGNGRLRFFSRNVNPISVDTQSAVITAGQWYHVVAVHDVAAQTRQIYVNGVAVQLSTGGAVSTYTGTWGSDSGAASIGGENNNAGSEAVANWRFNGNIDEFRIYDYALTDTQIVSVMNETHPCPLQPIAEWRFDECSYSGVAGEVIDTQGTYNATPFNGVSTNTPGQLGNYLDETNNTHQLRLATQVPLPTTWSIAAWFQTPIASTHRYHILGAMNGGGDVLYLDRDQNFTWGVFTPAGGAVYGTFQFGSLSSGWHQVMLVGNDQGANGQTLLYIDGSYVETVNLQAQGNLQYIGTSFDNANNSGSAQGFGTALDEFMVFDEVLSATQITSIYSNQLAGNNFDGSTRIPPPCGSVDHYDISHSGVGVTCEAESITIEAHDAAHALMTPSSSTTITLTTSIANDGWALQPSANGTFIAPNQYTFDGTEQFVEFWLTKTTATVFPHMNIDVSDGAASDLGAEDPILEFRDTALRFYADNNYNTLGTQIAGKSSSIAPGNQSMSLRAVQTNTDTGACEARISGTQTVQMAFECVNPATCKIANGVLITDDTLSTTTAIADNPLASLSSYANVDLTFDANGEASWTMNYLDAGQIALHANLFIPASGDDPADTLTGTSNTFTSKPAGLCVSSADVNADCGGSADVSCSPFRRTGEAFNLSVRAVRWESTGEMNTAFCSGNATTPNFQLSGITISHTLVAPLTAFTGLLGTGSLDINAAADGDGNIASQTISEVGIFTFTATAPEYFTETIAASTSANIGRFYPDHFALSLGTVNNRIDLGGVGNFSYMDEDFELSYTLTAQNSSNVTTQNYTTASGFAQLDSLAELNYVAADITVVPVNKTGRLTTISSGMNWINGEMLITDTVSISKNVTPDPDGPFNLMDIALAPIDEDSVILNSYDLDLDLDSANDHAIIGTTIIRFGRMTLGNVFGSELITLNMPMLAEYYNGTNFIVNTDDSLTPFSTTDLILSNLIEAGQTDGDIQLLAAQVSQAAIADNPLSSGNAGLTFCPPGNPACTATSGNEGFIDVQIDLSLFPYLKFDWDGDGSHDDDPTAKATFGIYSGDSKQIYYRQIYR